METMTFSREEKAQMVRRVQMYFNEELEQAIGSFRQALWIQPEFAEAWNNLERGRALFSDMGADAFIHETDVKIAEYHLLAHRPDTARTVTKAALSSMPADESTQRARTGLHRVLGYCAAAEGNPAEAEHQFRLSLKIAEEANALFEQAATYEGMARTLRTSTNAGDWNGRQAALYEQLGVVATPVIPLA